MKAEIQDLKEKLKLARETIDEFKSKLSATHHPNNDNSARITPKEEPFH